MRRNLMTRAVIALPVFMLLCAVSPAEKKNVPAVFGNATYVFVEAMDGDEFSPDLLPEDRDAIMDVRQALDKWGRYTLTLRRSEADLIFVVRKGRRATAKGGVIVRRRGPTGLGGLGGGDVGPSQDMLEVHMSSPGGSGSSESALGTRIWQRFEDDGLDAPDLPLVAELRTAVEHDYPAHPQKP